jgi:hypothetical protein
MHGQKKRRKRSLEGLIAVNGVNFTWSLLSEPQWTTEDGYKGLCISVRSEDDHHRELILEYPFPKKFTGNGLPQIPQRPKVSFKTIEADVRKAMAAGWNPESRGKSFVFKLTGM